MNAPAKLTQPVETGPAVIGAIAAVMEDLSKAGIGKDRKNAAQGYKFRGIDDVYNALAPILAKHRLVITPRCLSREKEVVTTKGGGTLFYVTVDVEFTLASAEDGSEVHARTFGEAMDSGDKATNKAMSAAYKYMAMQTFCIPTEGDNDADATTHEVAAKEPVSFVPAEPSGIFIACKAAIDMCSDDEKSLNDWKAMNEAAFKKMTPEELTEVKTYWQLRVKAVRDQAKSTPPKPDMGLNGDDVPTFN